MANNIDDFFDFDNKSDATSDLLMPQENTKQANDEIDINKVDVRFSADSSKESTASDKVADIMASIVPSQELRDIEVSNAKKGYASNKGYKQKTFWDKESIDNLYDNILDAKDVEFNENNYKKAISQLNLIVMKTRALNKDEKNIADIERLRTALVGNNLIAKLSGFECGYNFDELMSTIENALKTGKKLTPIIERVEKDACTALCACFGPVYMELSNSVRYTYVNPNNYIKRLEKIKSLRPMLKSAYVQFSNTFEKLDSKQVLKFMLETNFAPAFEIKDAFIGFNHIYDNVEKFNDPSKFNGEQVQLPSITNCFKIIDRQLGSGFFNKKELFELKSQKLERDKLQDNTDIKNGKGAKEWLK